MDTLELDLLDHVDQSADTILRGFEDYHERFRAITRRAKKRFERQDWRGIRRDTVERFSFQPQALAHTLELLREQLEQRLEDREVWSRVKTAYTGHILGRDDFELAQTFLNSLTRKLFPHVNLDPAIDYVPDDFPLPYQGWEMASARTYAVRQVSAPAVRKILEDADFRAPFRDLDATAERVARTAQEGLGEVFGDEPIEALDVLRPVFVRNKGAYIVGRARRGRAMQPLVLAIVHGEHGLEVDAVVQEEEEASIVFSFARWYFHADVETPRAVIGFLHSIMPRKRIAELYISLGYYKHGKTELYADLTQQIAGSRERFVVAPGQPGMVMSVFTLPSYEFVFKVIKDGFPPAKKTTRREIMDKYRMVLRHDRVGRLVDFQEFEDLAFKRSRFEDTLLHELLEVAGKTVRLDEARDRVVVHHMYVGRRVFPLDLFVRHKPPEEAEAAVIDWGHALRDLAAANIFPGDMLLKNFGVTRHGRVVFYDYDELRPLVDVRFRRIPPPRDEVEEMSAQPWFSVSSDDVFPEELHSFLGLGGRLREVFYEHHAELFEVGFWLSMQQRLRRGEVVDFYPYRRER